MKIPALLLTAGAILLASLIPVSAVERLSLTIGHNVGLAGEPRLHYATEDARRIHAVMTELGGVAANRGYLLLNRAPEEVDRVLGEIEGRVKEIKLAGRPVELIVFYSGHASRESLHMGGKPWPMESLRAFLGRVDADLKVTILDACNSGAFITRKGGILSEPIRFKEEDELKTRGSVVLTSSSALEFSHESKTLRGSLFSHYLLSGLRGAADYNRDRAVSLWEAYHYARLHTSRHLAGLGEASQSPNFDFSVAGGKDLILTSLDRGKSRIRFENCPPGTYVLYNQALSEQWAEVDLRDRDTVEINLPRMEFVVHRMEDNALHVAAADLRYRDDQTLRPADFRRTWLKDYRSKGGQPLRMPGGLDLRMRLLRQVPEQVAELVIPELGAHMHAGSHRWGAHLGLVASETDISRRIVRRGLSLGGSWGWEKFLRPWFSVGPETRLTTFVWYEETGHSRREIGILQKESAGSMVAGSNPSGSTGSTAYAGAAALVEDGFSMVQSLGAELHLKWRPLSRFHLDAGAGAEAFAYVVSDGSVEARVEFPVSLGVGFGLW